MTCLIWSVIILILGIVLFHAAPFIILFIGALLS